MLVKEQDPNVGGGYKVEYNKEEGSTNRSQKRKLADRR